MFDINNFKKKIKTLKSQIKKKKPVFFISSNLFNLGLLGEDFNFISKHLSSELSKIKDSTIIVPTATLNILNTSIVFDKKKTKSSRMGVFSEFIRKKKDAIRSNHPLWSFSGSGYYSKNIINKVPKNSYGHDSIFHRLLNYNTYYISLGDIQNTLSPIHFAEQKIGVPYRFFKEVKIKIRNKKKINRETYLFYAMILSPQIIKDNNKKITKILMNKKVFKTIKTNKFNIYQANYNLMVENLLSIVDKYPKIYLKNDKIKFIENLEFKS
jgi:aminoglycoside 3-N-acetyltransferase